MNFKTTSSFRLPSPSVNFRPAPKVSLFPADFRRLKPHISAESNQQLLTITTNNLRFTTVLKGKKGLPPEYTLPI